MHFNKSMKLFLVFLAFAFAATSQSNHWTCYCGVNTITGQFDTVNNAGVKPNSPTQFWYDVYLSGQIQRCIPDSGKLSCSIEWQAPVNPQFSLFDLWNNTDDVWLGILERSEFHGSEEVPCSCSRQ